MASLEQIFRWFSRGAFPTEEQYKQTWGSYWHKSERFPIHQILGLQEEIDNATTSFKGYHTDDVELKKAYPKATNKKDFFAWVGSNPTLIWKVYADGGDWENTNERPTQQEVDLVGYTKNGGSSKTMKKVDDELQVSRYGLDVVGSVIPLIGVVSGKTIDANTGVLSDSTIRLATIDMQIIAVGEHEFEIAEGYQVAFNEYKNVAEEQHRNLSWKSSGTYIFERPFYRPVFRKIDDSPITPAEFSQVGFKIIKNQWQSGNLSSLRNRLDRSISKKPIALEFMIGTLDSAGKYILPYNQTRLVSKMIELPIQVLKLTIKEGYEYSLAQLNADGTIYLNTDWNSEPEWQLDRSGVIFTLRKIDNSVMTIADLALSGFKVEGLVYDIQEVGTADVQSINNVLSSALNTKNQKVELKGEIVNKTISAQGVVGVSDTRISTDEMQILPLGEYEVKIDGGFNVVCNQYNTIQSAHYKNSGWLSSGIIKIEKPYSKLAFRFNDDRKITPELFASMGFSLTYLGSGTLANVENEVRSEKGLVKGVLPIELTYGTMNSSGKLSMPYNRTRMITARGFKLIPQELKISINEGYEYTMIQLNPDGSVYLDLGWNTLEKWNNDMLNVYFIIRKADDSVLTQQDVIAAGFKVEGTYYQQSIKEEYLINSGQMYQQYYYMKSDSMKRGNIIEVLDLIKVSQTSDMQSHFFDPIKKRIQFINGKAKLFTLDYDGKWIGEVTKTDTGHDNDCILRGREVYICGSTALGTELQSKELNKWNIDTNSVVNIPLPNIHNTIGKRVFAAICFENNSQDNALLIAHDYTGRTNQVGEKLGVYRFNFASQATELLFEIDWHGWFVQGATCVNDILYIATNKLPVGENPTIYGGMSIWVVDLKTQSLIDEMHIDGDVEPECLTHYIENGITYLYMGVAKAGRVAKLVKIPLM